jgi:Sec-independent protein secretion pathway component TatC
VLTPADPGSMLALALPLYALCELGMVLLRLFPAKRVAGEDPEIGDE